MLHYGIVAPAGTPRPIIDKLNAALRQALTDPDTIERMGRDGTEPSPGRRRNTPPTSIREETQVVGGGEAVPAPRGQAKLTSIPPLARRAKA